MIYEIHTRELRPGGMAEAERRMADALAARTAHSALGAFWRSEIGPLNQVIAIWPYRDMAHREEVARSWAADPDRPTDDDDLVSHEEVEIWRPAPFMRPFDARETGGVFEMRTYTFKPGTMGHVLDIWAAAVPERERLSPLVACWVSETGTLNRLRHIWAYPSLDERARIRRAAFELASWPPMTREWRIGEESSILLPAAFSPIR